MVSPFERNEKSCTHFPSERRGRPGCPRKRGHGTLVIRPCATILIGARGATRRRHADLRRYNAVRSVSRRLRASPTRKEPGSGRCFALPSSPREGSWPPFLRHPTLALPVAPPRASRTRPPC